MIGDIKLLLSVEVSHCSNPAISSGITVGSPVFTACGGRDIRSNLKLSPRDSYFAVRRLCCPDSVLERIIYDISTTVEFYRACRISVRTPAPRDSNGTSGIVRAAPMLPAISEILASVQTALFLCCLRDPVHLNYGDHKPTPLGERFTVLFSSTRVVTRVRDHDFFELQGTCATCRKFRSVASPKRSNCE
jgi:hypothetical protein